MWVDVEQIMRQIRALGIEVPVLICSGYSETDEVRAIKGAAHLGKPYQHDQLAAVLSEAVA